MGLADYKGSMLCDVVAHFCFLSGRRRLTNRRIDWLLWILHTKVAEYYHSRMQQQDLGVQKNHQSYRSIKNATQADRQPDNSVTIVGGEAQVKSATAPGVTHTLELTEERGPQCTCTAGKMGKMCWHVVKVLLHLGASKNQLLRYLGTLDGAVGGGFKELQSAMSDSLDTVDSSGGGDGGQTVASDATPEELADLSINDMEQDGASDPADSSAECALAEPSAGVRGRPKAAAQAAMAALNNMSLSWEDDSPNWKFLLVAARHAKDKVERALAGTNSFEDVSGSELIPNADAWEGPQRKDFVEIATDKRKHQQKLAANAAIRAAARAAAKGSSDSDEGPSQA